MYIKKCVIIIFKYSQVSQIASKTKYVQTTFIGERKKKNIKTINYKFKMVKKKKKMLYF